MTDYLHHLVRAHTRKQIMAQIIATMEEAHESGADPWAAAERAYPGTPTAVIAEAWAEFDYSQTEAWWRSIEKTIDGEVIRNALASGPKP